MGFVFSLLIAGGVVALDLISKAIVEHTMILYEHFNVIPYLFDFQYVRNKGAAFSFLAGWEHSRIFFVVLTFIAVAAFIYVLWRFGKRSKLFSVAMALIIGGAVGNLYDRLVFHYVRDFIQFAFWDSFAIFNIADCALTIGVVLFAIYYIFLFQEEDSKKKRTAGKSDGQDPPAGTSEIVLTEGEPQRQAQEPDGDLPGKSGKGD